LSWLLRNPRGRVLREAIMRFSVSKFGRLLKRHLFTTWCVAGVLRRTKKW
jgi:hypothetical protein